MEIVLAIGPEQIRKFLDLVDERVATSRKPLTKHMLHELRDAGIDRRLTAIDRILKVGCLADYFGLEEFWLGQVNSKRVAMYIADRFEAAFSMPGASPEIGTPLAEKLAAAGF